MDGITSLVFYVALWSSVSVGKEHITFLEGDCEALIIKNRDQVVLLKHCYVG
jgi:hypothetical protein